MLREEPFGKLGERDAIAYSLTSDSGITARLTNYGARLTELHVPGRYGQAADIVLGFDDVTGYVESDAYFGATVGRYGNRISRGSFTILGPRYLVDRNEGPNHLHGGSAGWDRFLWDVEVPSDGSAVTFRTHSPDGDMGFPGACAIRATYELKGTRLSITMEAEPDAPTVINMVHHSFFNLAGHDSGNVLEQHLELAGDFYVPVDGELLPTGEILSVADTPYDFRRRHAIGEQLESVPAVGAGVFEGGGGWDHNWCLRAPGADGLTDAAVLHDPGSGRTMRLRTSEPGVQMYTGGYLTDRIVGKNGRSYCQYAGLTLETQKFPDSPNVAHFPSALVSPGDCYTHRMVFDFSAD